MSDLVDATDLDLWASRRDAQARLPQLIRRLIAESASTVHRLDFPAGEGVQRQGFDGIAEVGGTERFAPDGLSVWELSTSADVRSKAEEDHTKRTEDPKAIDPSTATYVAATVRRWPSKREWIDSKIDGPWKEVIALDADDLETWLESAPATHAWISVLLGKDPQDAVALITWWDRWVGATSPRISGQLVLAGRTQTATQLVDRLVGQPGVITLAADSPDEAIAFLAAALKADDRFEAEQLFTRSVVVHNQTGWTRSVAVGQGAVLIPTFTEPDIGSAVSNDHRVVVQSAGLGAATGEVIELGRVRRNAAREALESMGVPEKDVEELALIARRSLMSIRRWLGIAPRLEVPLWATPAEAAELIPALLAGVWEDSREGDQEAVAELGARAYADVQRSVTRWSNESDPPIRRLGDTWMLVSKEDAWHLLAGQLTTDDLRRFHKVAHDVLSTPDPTLELPKDEQWMAAVRGVAPKHSGLLRKGLADTIALVASRPGDQQLANRMTGQILANIIVSELLKLANEDGSGRLWTSLSGVLPLLAEAAPDVFLEALNAGSSGEDPVIMKMFTDSADYNPMFSSSAHTGLLWALEVLAWDPRYLGSATLVLARLAQLDPGGTWANRPQDSLRTIFLPWHPQTSASLDERLAVLDTLLDREPDAATTLLADLLRQSHGIASPTHPPKWRGWHTEPQLAHAEWGVAIEQITTRLLTTAEATPETWLPLIDRLSSLPQNVQDTVLSQLEQLDPESVDSSSRSAIAEAVRAEAARHQRFSDTQWAMPTEQVQRLESIYECIAPSDAVSTSAWLFSHHPDLPDQTDRDWDAYREKLSHARDEAVATVLGVDGLASIEQLAELVEIPSEVGLSLGRVGVAAEDEHSVFDWMDTEADVPRQIARGYVFGQFDKLGWDWVDETLRQHETEWPPSKQAEYLLGVTAAGRVWDWADRLGEETTSQYWSTATPRILTDSAEYERAARALVEHGRPLTAVELLVGSIEGVDPPTDAALIAEVLEAGATTPIAENVSGTMLQYYVARLLDHVEATQELDNATLARLEWLYLPLLRHGDRPPRLLHQELTEDPEFFAEVITWIFRGEDEDWEPTQEHQARAQAGFHLLESWKGLPGLREDGTVDAEMLREWVHKARTILHEKGRGDIGDQRIGSVLRYSPVDGDGVWPHEAVRELIEELEGEHFERGIEVQVYNSRGVTSRGVYDGGDQERELANQYAVWAEATQARWPRTSAMLRRLAESYEHDGRRHDEDAERHEDL